MINTDFVYALFKNCRNLSLKYSGAYLFNSELILFSPGLLPFFVNFKAFPNSAVVINYYMIVQIPFKLRFIYVCCVS
jgi:hypothetical protein